MGVDNFMIVEVVNTGCIKEDMLLREGSMDFGVLRAANARTGQRGKIKAERKV